MGGIAGEPETTTFFYCNASNRIAVARYRVILRIRHGGVTDGEAVIMLAFQASDTGSTPVLFYANNHLMQSPLFTFILLSIIQLTTVSGREVSVIICRDERA